jgi:hypothetical protein
MTAMNRQMQPIASAASPERNPAFRTLVKRRRA